MAVCSLQGTTERGHSALPNSAAAKSKRQPCSRDTRWKKKTGTTKDHLAKKCAGDEDYHEPDLTKCPENSPRQTGVENL